MRGRERLCACCGALYTVPPTDKDLFAADHRILCPACWRRTSLVARYGLASREVELAAAAELAENAPRVRFR